MSMKNVNLVALVLFLGFGLAMDDARADAAETLIEQCHVQFDLSVEWLRLYWQQSQDGPNAAAAGPGRRAVTDDAAATESLMSQMTVEEMTEAAEWMMNAPTVCEQQ